MSTLTMSDMVNRVHTKIAGGSCPVSSDLKTEIKWALHLSHNEIFDGIDYTWMRRSGNLTTVSGTQEYTLPFDFSRMVEPSLEIPAENITLRYIKTQHLDQWRPSRFDGTGRPTRYSIPDSYRATGRYRLLLYPSPDAAYAMTFRYFSKPDEIHALADAAAFDARFPDSYYTTLYLGALSQLSDYLDNTVLQKAVLDYRNAKAALRRGNLIIKGDRHQKERYRASPTISGLGTSETPLQAPSDILSP